MVSARPSPVPFGYEKIAKGGAASGSSGRNPSSSDAEKRSRLAKLPQATLETAMQILNTRSGIDSGFRVCGYGALIAVEILKAAGAPKGLNTHLTKGITSLVNARTMLRLVGIPETVEGMLTALKCEDQFERTISTWQNALMFAYYPMDNTYCAADVMGLLPLSQSSAYAVSRGSCYLWGVYIVLDLILDRYRYKKAQAKYSQIRKECDDDLGDCFTEELGLDIQRKARQGSRRFRLARRVWTLKTIANLTDSILAFHFAHPRYPLPNWLVGLAGFISTICGLTLRSIRIRIQIEQQRRQLKR